MADLDEAGKGEVRAWWKHPLLVIAGVLGVLAVTLVVGVSIGRDKPANEAALISSEGPLSSCTAYESGHAVMVTITSPVGDAACEQWVRGSSSQMAYWTTDPTRKSGETANAGVVCDMSKGRYAMVVEDAGSQTEGTSICGRLAAQGWTASSPQME